MNDNIAIIVNSLLYILNKFEGRTTDSHQLFKILYFAEQMHLSRYGKSITPDKYAAMKYGPVPSTGFRIVNCSKSDGDFGESINEASKLINVKGYTITSNSEVDMDWLSSSEISCLDQSFEENKSLSFGQLTDKSHDSAWDNAYHYMDKGEIAKAGGANEDMVKYITSKDELKHIRF